MKNAGTETAEEVWKFPLGNGGVQNVEMPMHAEILTVQQQNGHTCIWAKVRPDNEIRVKRIHVIGTGHPMPGEPLAYLGTVQQAGGMFVWHIFEEVQ